MKWNPELSPATQAAEEAEAHALTPLLQELKRRYGDIEIDLGQSTPQMDRAFVDALLDSEPNQLPETFRAELFQRTRGHPLFTVELLRHMQERGDLVQDSQGRWIEGGAVDWEALPARVEAVISQRIGRLPAILQEGLKIASVEGETFTAEVIAHILGVDGWEMVQQLSGVAGRQHRLVTGQGNQRLGTQVLSRYRFVHICFKPICMELWIQPSAPICTRRWGTRWSNWQQNRPRPWPYSWRTIFRRQD